MLTREDIVRILQEYTKENGGQTPGEAQFYKNTEVGKWDRMKNWPNYGELVREAGLVPNKFDKTKYTKDQLCEMFIEVTHGTNRWPTRGELETRHYRDSSFPHSSTFYKKLGLSAKLAKTILEFVNDKQGYEDVVKICNSALEKFEDKEEKKDQVGQITHGWVYLIRHGQYRQYRIGQTSDLLRRGSEIKIQLPERATLVYSIETVDPVGVETYWLNRFRPKQMNGDWFNLSPTDVKEFKAWKRII